MLVAVFQLDKGCVFVSRDEWWCTSVDSPCPDSSLFSSKTNYLKSSLKVQNISIRIGHSRTHHFFWTSWPCKYVTKYWCRLLHVFRRERSKGFSVFLELPGQFESTVHCTKISNSSKHDIMKDAYQIKSICARITIALY